MSNQGQAQEPTMEEILASIRRIISEDSGADDAAAEQVPPPPAYEAEPETYEAFEEEILELTEALPEEPAQTYEPAPVEPPVYTAPAPEAADAGQYVEDDVQFSEVSETLLSPEPEIAALPVESQNIPAYQAPEPVAEAAVEPEAPITPEIRHDEEIDMSAVTSSLLSSETETAAAAAFGALSSQLGGATGANARTVEDLVSEMLRPMLKDWLDENLPSLVERLVAEEIERVARRNR